MNGTKENTIETNTMRKSIYACLVVKVQKSTAFGTRPIILEGT